jgi:hypothetical protein
MGKEEPNRTKKCKCRQLIEYKEADQKVKLGEALWVVIKRERGLQEEVCRHCGGVNDTPNCDVCKGTGVEKLPAVWDTYNGDIALINHRTKSNRISTPKVPTIEAGHINRAVVFKEEDDKVAKEARERIEEYGRMTQWSLQRLGAELRDGKTKELLIYGRPEPENSRITYPPGTLTFKDGSKNKSWYTVTTGRDFDRGRTI